MNTEEKLKTKNNRKRIEVSKEALVELAAQAAAGASRRELMKRYPNAPERLISAIVAVRIGADEFDERLSDELRRLSLVVAAEISEDLRGGKISPNSKALFLGIIVDKLRLIEGKTALRSINTNFNVNTFHGPGGLTKEEIIRALQGLPEALAPVVEASPSLLMEKSVTG